MEIKKGVVVMEPRIESHTVKFETKDYAKARDAIKMYERLGIEFGDITPIRDEFGEPVLAVRMFCPFVMCSAFIEAMNKTGLYCWWSEN
jgi:hypothetical protein